MGEGGKCGLLTAVGKCGDGLRCKTKNANNEVIMCHDAVFSSHRMACLCQREQPSILLIIIGVLVIFIFFVVLGIFIRKRTRNNRINESFEEEDPFVGKYSISHGSQDVKKTKFHILSSQSSDVEKDSLSMGLLCKKL